MKNGVKLGNSSHPLTCLQKGIFEAQSDSEGQWWGVRFAAAEAEAAVE